MHVLVCKGMIVHLAGKMGRGVWWDFVTMGRGGLAHQIYTHSEYDVQCCIRSFGPNEANG